MPLPPERQGYIGDLMNKTVAEVQELIERQEKILSKRKFLETLPDKGEKAKKFADQLKMVLKLKTCPTHVAQKIRKDEIPYSPVLEAVAKRDEINVEIQQTDVNSESRHDDNTSSAQTVGELSAELEKMSFNSSGTKTNVTPPPNSYERVIKRAEVSPSAQKQKFMPNRSLLDTRIPEPPYAKQRTPRKTDKGEEESAVKPPIYKFQESKLVSVEESIKLIKEQRSRNEELIAQRAAQKLADQLVPKMDIYTSGSTDMQYRDRKTYFEEDQDSDDSDDSQNGD